MPIKLYSIFEKKWLQKVLVMIYNFWHFKFYIFLKTNNLLGHIKRKLFPFVKVFRFQRKTLLFLLGFFFPIIIFFSYRFCSADFSKTTRSIFMKFSHMIPYDINLLYFFLFWWRHFRFRKIDDFVIFDRSFCPERFSKMGRERHLKFSRMIDKRLKLCKICFKCI